MSRFPFLGRFTAPLLACLFLAPMVQAAEIFLVPELNLKTEWNDNLDLSRTREKSDYIATLAPAFTVNAGSERFDLSSRLGVDLRRYAQYEEKNTEYLRFSANGGYGIGERLRGTAHISFAEDEALQSELEETGQVVPGVDRRLYAGGLGFQYSLTPSSMLSLDGSHQKTEYSGGGFIDQSQESLSLAYRRTLKDELNGVLLQPYYSRFESDRSKIDNYGFSVGWTRSWTQTLNSQAVLGIRHTRSEYNVLQQELAFDPALLPAYPYRLVANEARIKETNWGGTADISLTRRVEASQMSTGYKRDLEFSAEGEAIVTDRLYCILSRGWTERFSAGLTASLTHSESEGERSQTDDWYLDVGPFISWNISRNHVLTAGYGYSAAIDDTEDDTRAERHRVWVGLGMRFPRRW